MDVLKEVTNVKINSMKKVLFFALAVLIASCVSKGTNVPVTDSVDNFKVEKLFNVDGVTVYRFYDSGRGYVYFTNKTGKICHYNESEEYRVETLCNE